MMSAYFNPFSHFGTGIYPPQLMNYDMDLAHRDDKSQRILATISAVPKGSVSTYGHIALRAGLKGYARYVGYVLRNLPEGSRIPWYRIVTSKGTLAFPVNSDAFCTQRKRLQEEGLEVTPDGKITDFRAHMHQD